MTNYQCRSTYPIWSSDKGLVTSTDQMSCLRNVNNIIHFELKKKKKMNCFKSNRFLEEIKNKNSIIVFPAFGFKAQLGTTYFEAFIISAIFEKLCLIHG